MAEKSGQTECGGSTGSRIQDSQQKMAIRGFNIRLLGENGTRVAQSGNLDEICIISCVLARWFEVAFLFQMYDGYSGKMLRRMVFHLRYFPPVSEKQDSGFSKGNGYEENIPLDAQNY